MNSIDIRVQDEIRKFEIKGILSIRRLDYKQQKARI